MTTLLDKTRQINELLQQKNTFNMDSDLPYDKMAIILGDILDSNAYIISSNGSLLGFNEKHDVNNARVKNMFVEKQFPKTYTDMVDNLHATEANITIDSDMTAFPIESRELYPNGLTTVVPIFGAGERLGTIILSRIDDSFDDNDLVLAEYSATVVGMQILYQTSRNIEEDIRSATAVQMAVNTLSYSELKAVQAIFNALEGDEGRLTASNIADEIGITRSVIVNALRKLESAGIIESRSLGMKGTYLKVLNHRFKDELDKA
ncbi:GTP-sensing pleiotropic transcriptional regulator CodY [Enterococcus saccharolyticus]|uniref:Global transcriptional regulator CodY n=1 Tax=Enterococcus saccharolyticus subsp. saccharolyticus ATCC 43076 TaxID=1139996 RepID=S0JP51_9ENTE|nr:GTP-sensing pleiotropic transcriptional regulator CodY [Enterococcus saccharolyticus]EOT29673.1 GTP-sensing transcriptional pleiotropic repressor CodY [Enterococcus saccharolyticus subsp. saccharolyticus ATCC 43076]EOT80833.1 GTP-sensing transcriptional pleiotropic repressor CodY [Enterococcus saccharolyticus subsp. saccharolyticus ATCC 43076]OJG89707.1 GTP-sensing transcriptional pleiotropic repressor CodY [Enterococcus saccharolyticus]